MAELSDIIGKTMTSVVNNDDEIIFSANDGSIYKMHHLQDCCESVYVEDVAGDLSDLVGSPILQAEEVSSGDEPAPAHADSYTWTFYKLATIKGSVTIRWLGESNGYYSESVQFDKV